MSSRRDWLDLIRDRVRALNGRNANAGDVATWLEEAYQRGHAVALNGDAVRMAKHEKQWAEEETRKVAKALKAARGENATLKAAVQALRADLSDARRQRGEALLQHKQFYDAVMGVDVDDPYERGTTKAQALDDAPVGATSSDVSSK